MKTFLIIVLLAIIVYVVYAVVCAIKCAKLDAEIATLKKEMDEKYGGGDNNDR